MIYFCPRFTTFLSGQVETKPVFDPTTVTQSLQKRHDCIGSRYQQYDRRNRITIQRIVLLRIKKYGFRHALMRYELS